MRTFSEGLCDRKVYQQQIEHLHARHAGSQRLHRLQQDGVSFATLVHERRKVARLLASTVRDGTYRSGPARPRTIWVGGKERVVYSYALVDTIVHGAVAALIEEATTRRRSARLYSYRAGMSSWRAVADFAAWVRTQTRLYSDPRQRHLYVLRRDVKSYTDSIPVHRGAPIWGMLRADLGEMSEAHWSVLETVVRPEVLTDGTCVRPDLGLPMGQPISGVLANLYLHELDAWLESIEGGFYARYCDDILFAHPNPEVARWASGTIDSTLAGLGLHCHDKKRQDFYLTGAGRHSEHWPESKPANRVSFLGTTVAACGTVALERGKARRLLREVSERARRSVKVLGPHAGETARGRMICAIANHCLDPDTAPVQQQRSAALVRRVVTDRNQLAELDYQLARIVVRAVTGDGDVRGFRRIPYRRVRQEWNLLSLEHARNQWGRKGRN